LLFNLGDRGCRDILYDMPATRRFADLSYGRPMPDETTMPDFRRLSECPAFGEAIFKAINEHLGSHGFKLSKSVIVNATIVGAPSQTESKEQARDPETHSTKKGCRWHFGMISASAWTRRRGGRTAWTRHPRTGRTSR